MLILIDKAAITVIFYQRFNNIISILKHKLFDLI
jgi:hypothetical protein